MPAVMTKPTENSVIFTNMEITKLANSHSTQQLFFLMQSFQHRKAQSGSSQVRCRQEGGWGSPWLRSSAILGIPTTQTSSKPTTHLIPFR